MQKIIFVLLLLSSLDGAGQELFVYSEPASNMPAHSMSFRMTGNLIPKGQSRDQRFMQRYSPEIMLGLNRKWMLHASASFADMHTGNFRWESVDTYIKYRFFSSDDLHKHFRMAAFGEGSYTRSPFELDEVSLRGDKNGVTVGVIATQLLNRLAVSATLSHTQVFDASRNDKIQYSPARNYQSINYILSAGYLLFPRNYSDYKQTNVNLYIEMPVQQTLDRKTSYLDLAPAVQFIFNSNSRLDIGYRFQVSGHMERMSRQNILVSFERTFLNALKTKRRR